MYNIMALAKEDVRTLDVLADIEADDTGIEPDLGIRLSQRLTE